MLQLLFLIPRKRVLAALLAVFMVLALCPSSRVYAASINMGDGILGLSFESDKADKWSYTDGNLSCTVTTTTSEMCGGTMLNSEDTELVITNTAEAYSRVSFNYSIQLNDGLVSIDDEEIHQSDGKIDTVLPANGTIKVRLKSPGSSTASTSITISNISNVQNFKTYIVCKASDFCPYSVNNKKVNKKDVLVPAAASDSVTITPEPKEGYKLREIIAFDSENNQITVRNNSFTMPNDKVTVMVSYEVDQEAFTMDGDNITINNAAGWGVFCDLLDYDRYNGFTGKTVTLGTDLSNITRCAGTLEKPFKGVFDGNSKTINVAINDTTTEGTALFRKIKDGAVIKNLTVTGMVVGTNHVAGLVGFSEDGSEEAPNTISNCTISTSVDGNNTQYIGGVVGHGLSSYLRMEKVVFNGALKNKCGYTGALMGWSNGNSLTVIDSIFCGDSENTELFHPIEINNYGADMSVSCQDVYYTVAPTFNNDKYFKATGEQIFHEQPFGFVSEKFTAPDNEEYYKIKEDGDFSINDEDDWKSFADTVNLGVSYKGKTIKLSNDINVTKSVGTPVYDFEGIFDGQGHSLNIDFSANADYCAPFSCVKDASFSRISILGKIITDKTYSAGLIGRSRGTVSINNCSSKVTIVSDIDGSGYHGGFVGINNGGSGNISFEGCVFEGKLLDTKNTGSCGGFVWKE